MDLPISRTLVQNERIERSFQGLLPNEFPGSKSQKDENLKVLLQQSAEIVRITQTLNNFNSLLSFVQKDVFLSKPLTTYQSEVLPFVAAEIISMMLNTPQLTYVERIFTVTEQSIRRRSLSKFNPEQLLMTMFESLGHLFKATLVGYLLQCTTEVETFNFLDEYFETAIHHDWEHTHDLDRMYHASYANRKFHDIVFHIKNNPNGLHFERILMTPMAYTTVIKQDTEQSLFFPIRPIPFVLLRHFYRATHDWAMPKDLNLEDETQDTLLDLMLQNFKTTMDILDSIKDQNNSKSEHLVVSTRQQINEQTKVIIDQINFLLNRWKDDPKVMK